MNDYPKNCAECGKYEIVFDEFAGLESANAVCKLLTKPFCELYEVQDSLNAEGDIMKWLMENKSSYCPMLKMYSHEELTKRNL